MIIGEAMFAALREMMEGETVFNRATLKKERDCSCYISFPCWETWVPVPNV